MFFVDVPHYLFMAPMERTTMHAQSQDIEMIARPCFRSGIELDQAGQVPASCGTGDSLQGSDEAVNFQETVPPNAQDSYSSDGT